MLLHLFRKEGLQGVFGAPSLQLRLRQADQSVRVCVVQVRGTLQVGIAALGVTRRAPQLGAKDENSDGEG